MAFIKNQERKSLIRKINQSYTLRKIVILLEIILLIGFIVISFVSWRNRGESPNSPWAWFTDDKKLTTLGICMAALAAIIGFFGVISIILIFTIKSPKQVINVNKKLESSALSGKKISKKHNAIKVMKSRTTIKEKK